MLMMRYIIVCIEETWISWRTSCGCRTSTRSIRAGCARWLVVVAYVSLFCNVQQIAASARSYLKEKSLLADNLFGSRDLQGIRDLFGSRASKANRVPGDPYPFHRRAARGCLETQRHCHAYGCADATIAARGFRHRGPNALSRAWRSPALRSYTCCLLSKKHNTC